MNKTTEKWVKAGYVDQRLTQDQQDTPALLLENQARYLLDYPHLSDLNDLVLKIVAQIPLHLPSVEGVHLPAFIGKDDRAHIAEVHNIKNVTSKLFEKVEADPSASNISEFSEELVKEYLLGSQPGQTVYIYQPLQIYPLPPHSSSRYGLSWRGVLV